MSERLTSGMYYTLTRERAKQLFYTAVHTQEHAVTRVGNIIIYTMCKFEANNARSSIGCKRRTCFGREPVNLGFFWLIRRFIIRRSDPVRSSATIALLVDRCRFFL